MAHWPFWCQFYGLRWSINEITVKPIIRPITRWCNIVTWFWMAIRENHQPKNATPSFECCRKKTLKQLTNARMIWSAVHYISLTSAYETINDPSIKTCLPCLTQHTEWHVSEWFTDKSAECLHKNVLCIFRFFFFGNFSYDFAQLLLSIQYSHS